MNILIKMVLPQITRFRKNTCSISSLFLPSTKCIKLTIWSVINNADLEKNVLLIFGAVICPCRRNSLKASDNSSHGKE